MAPRHRPVPRSMVPEGAIGVGVIGRNTRLSSANETGHDTATHSYRALQVLNTAPPAAPAACACKRLGCCVRGDRPVRADPRLTSIGNPALASRETAGRRDLQRLHR